VYNKKYSHTFLNAEKIATTVELQFACIEGAKKIAAGAAAVLSAYLAM